MTFINFAEAELDSLYTSSDSTFDVVMTSTVYDLVDDLTDANLSGGGRGTIIHAETGQPMRFQWSSLSSLSDSADGRKRYTVTIAIADDASTKMVGLANTGDGTNAVANVIAGNSIASIPEGSKVYFGAVGADDYNQLQGQFQATSGQDANYVAGEAISIRESVSLHTDNKLYKYHDTNYPGLFGIADAAYAVDDTVTVIRNGGSKSGFSGLTANALVYAENTGAVTQTASATTSILGRADTTSIVRVGLPTNNLEPATPGEVTAESGDGVTSVTNVKAIITANAPATSYPTNIYVSASESTFNATTTYTETHNLAVTQADVEAGKYKVIITGKNSSKGHQLGDTGGANTLWGGNGAGSVGSVAWGVVHVWSASDPVFQSDVNWQTNAIKFDMGSSALTNARVIIQQMFD